MQDEPLPGRAFSNYNYDGSPAKYSVELSGDPDEEGYYTVSNILWWHHAWRPSRSSGLKQGEPCFAIPDGYQLGPPRPGSHWQVAQEKEITHFKSVEDLDGLRLSPSITCPRCGVHIHITFYLK